ncbi:uncharacterized protein LOC124196912 isoform X1 [Daphnia pulex]|uniref:uncharacterized protein LOC124196912 isoform X1 n=1 Tax=Daphnia pulex TaxID=6669 RepID=UPI001EDEEBCD|nr:uncharacterized protein LOC124196912 isoform X1 [Daphnia pulex]XP_046448120.1 uncharacterized protein LOC124196912 isoform X1 [Daphnia pulex]
MLLACYTFLASLASWITSVAVTHLQSLTTGLWPDLRFYLHLLHTCSPTLILPLVVNSLFSYKIVDDSVGKYQLFSCFKQVNYCSDMKFSIILVAFVTFAVADSYKAAEYEAPKNEAPKYEAPKYEAPKYEAPKYEAPKYEAPKYEAPKYEAPKYEAPKYETPKYEAPKNEAPKYEAPKYEAPKYEAPKYEAPKYEAPKYEAPKYEAPKYEAPKYEAPKYEAPKYETPKYEEVTYAPQPYSFGYNVQDKEFYNDFEHNEKSDYNVVSGSYRVVLPDSRIQIVTYKADANGYTADVKYEGEAKYPENAESKADASYSAPSYKAPEYKQPAYVAPAYAAPSYTTPAYKEPEYETPAYTTKATAPYPKY